ncbi:signal recognition particle-docking protein FtsY [Companilactobacillus allii]|uniref:Signal recognition particle receptor FtsY n=1 Tax=Companilactobacillus allii TaxID=1847728 RepID=A0A1P8Q469_9LACO|nr:signal recognition particle-docking protein FtsY [Companilactobacillus allii]APX72599.1 signal recognition particle-docking protein FtsY [Companilactobacillus allii]USQ69703.1 signal recognition particle-docking protein FtsY [Companilactobacillus allii]
MGLFDRIKKAFTGKDDDEEKKSTEESIEKQESTEDTKEDDTQTLENVDNNEVEKPVEPTEKSTDEPGEKSIETTDSEDVSKKLDTTNTDEVTKVKEEVKPHTSEPVKEVESNTSVQEEPEDIESESDSSETITDTTTTSESPAESDESTDEDEKEKSEEKDVKEYDEGLKKSRNSFSTRFNHFLANFRSVDEDFFDDLEELLIESDVGYETAMRISDELREEVKLENVKKRSDVSDVIVRKLVDMYDEEGKEEDNSLKFSTDKVPTVFLFVGVNGAGKTTTIGKLAHRYQQEGKKVLLAAGDTFRAGAIEQLQEWGRRVDVPVEASKPQTDPASVVFDAVKRAINENFDILLVDTAGRLQNKEGLMRELEKIKRVITRELPEAPQEVLLVLDGSTGQNALSQAKQFNETTEVSGIVLTKIDGSSQGGIVLAIRNELHIPVKLVGLGEQMDDLRDFDPEKFIYGLFKELIVGSGK